MLSTCQPGRRQERRCLNGLCEVEASQHRLPLSVIQVCCDVRTPVPVVPFITQKSQKSLPVSSFQPISAPWASFFSSARSGSFLSALSLCCCDDGELRAPQFDPGIRLSVRSASRLLHTRAPHSSTTPLCCCPALSLAALSALLAAPSQMLLCVCRCVCQSLLPPSLDCARLRCELRLSLLVLSQLHLSSSSTLD